MMNAPPQTYVEAVTEVLCGVSIADPYRWLEDQDSPRTNEWVEAQTQHAHQVAIPLGHGHLLALRRDQLQFRDAGGQLRDPRAVRGLRQGGDGHGTEGNLTHLGGERQLEVTDPEVCERVYARIERCVAQLANALQMVMTSTSPL